MHSARRQLHIPIVSSIITEEDWLKGWVPVLIFFAVSKCAYTLRWIRSFATDLYFPNQWQTFLGFLCMRYLDVSETVSVVCICKQTCKNDWRNHKVKIWKGYIFTPVWYNLDIYDFKHYDSLTPYKLSVFEYMYI